MPPKQSSSPLSMLREDIRTIGVDISAAEWENFANICSEACYKKKQTVFENPDSKKFILFITDGICAGQFVQPDGQIVVGRFFERGDFCATIDAASHGRASNHSVLALTPVEGVLIPMEWWRKEHFEGDGIGRYAREKMFKMHIFDIGLLQVKTINRTSVSYEFLRDHQPNVLNSVPQRVIAQFLGITPEGFSRFLKSNPKYL